MLKTYLLDKQREANLKVYPLLQNSVVDNIDFGGNYGIMTGVTYSELELNISGTLGGLGGVEEDGFIKVFYIRKHVKVTDLTTTLFVSDVAEKPLAHYIAGYALRDNQDTQNRLIAKEELSLYEKSLEEYNIVKAKNFSQSQFKTTYNPTGA